MNGKNRIAVFATCAALVSQTAHAADSVYLGDCTRARQVQQQSTIDTLLPHSRYEGIQRMYMGDSASTACPQDRLLTFSLTQTARSSSQVVFNTMRKDFFAGNKASGCAAPSDLGTPKYGSVTFTTQFTQRGELCEVYIWASFVQYKPNTTTTDTSFASRIVTLEGGAFAMAQPAPIVGKYHTPISFTGAK
jgi:hypothetical protein